VLLVGSKQKEQPATGMRSMSAVDLYVAEKQVALQRANGTLWVRSVADISEGIFELATELGSAPTEGGSRVTRLHVWLGASLCRPVRLAALAGALSASERIRVGEASAIAQAGLPAPARIWLDAPDATGSRLAVVVEQRVLDVLDTLAATLRARLMSVRPLWSEVLKLALIARPATEALAVWEDGALTLLVGAGEAITVARTTTTLRDASAANAAFLRATIGEGVDHGASVAVSLDLKDDAMQIAPAAAEPFLAGLPFGEWVLPLRTQS
jgi:hypothetical protein